MGTSSLELLNLVQGIPPGRLSRATDRQCQSWAIVGSTQLGRHQQDLVSEGLQRGILKFRGQAQPLEPVDEVVGEQKQMEVGLVGKEVASGNAAEGIVAFELFDEQLDPRPVVVEAPEVQRLQRQIGDQDLLVILAEFEERQLVGGFLGLKSPDHDEAIRMGPPQGLIAEFGDLDASAGTHVPEVRQLAFDRGRQTSDDHEPDPLRFESLDQRMVVKPFVRADNHQPDAGGHLREARRKQVARPTGGMGIARPQLPVPEVLGSAFEAQQRVIRRPPPLDWVVADPGLLLLTIDDEHGRVDIEDQPRRRMRMGRHALEEAVVEPAQLRQYRRGYAQQDAAERGGVGIVGQPGQVLKHAVLPQQVRRFDPLQTEDHGVQQGQQHLADAVGIVPLGHENMPSNGVLKAKLRQEPMQQIDAAVMRQARGAKLNGQLSRASGHLSEGY
jgi:hypothetical protein